MKKITLVSLIAALIAIPAVATNHTVVKGDWLSKIAPKYKTTVDCIVEKTVPPIKNKDLIYPAQKVNVDPCTSGKKVAAVAESKKSETKKTETKKTVVASSNDISNFYVAGRVGLALEDDNSDFAGKHVTDLGGVYRIALGYDFDPVRVEVEYGYANNFDARGHWGETGGTYDPTVYGIRTQFHNVMANVFYDFDMNGWVKPFVNVGVGYVNIRNRSYSYVGDPMTKDLSDQDYEQNWAFSAGAGFSWTFTERLKGEMAYRFSDFGHVHATNQDRESFDLHEVTVGLRYHF